MVKISAHTQRAKSHESSNPMPLASPVFAGIERPVTTAQLAEHLQVTTRTIANYREQRIIPFWRLNQRRILYRLNDVERCLSLNNR